MLTVNAGSSSLRLASYTLETVPRCVAETHYSPLPPANPDVLASFMREQAAGLPDLVMHRVSNQKAGNMTAAIMVVQAWLCVANRRGSTWEAYAPTSALQLHQVEYQSQAVTTWPTQTRSESTLDILIGFMLVFHKEH